MWIAPLSSAAIIYEFESWRRDGEQRTNSDNETHTFVKRLENRLRLKAEQRNDKESEKSRLTPALQRPDLLRNITGGGNGGATVEDLENKTPVEGQSSEPKTVECVIVVGTTGTGKSSTIAKYTGQTVRVSSGPESQTRHCEIFKNNRESDGNDAVWIDTVGYDDTNRLSDQSSFQEVLRFIDDHDLRDVRAIVWTVMPQERKDARLQKQAEFINLFKEGEVWDNVIILAKQPGGYNVDLACQGALEAARAHAWENSKVRTVGFTYMDSSIPLTVKKTLQSLDSEDRRRMLLVTDDDVHQILKREIDSIDRPLQIIFRDSKCLDCGVIGDRRLLPRYCHFEMTLVHDNPIPVPYHQDDTEDFHTLDLESHHPGVLRLEGGPNKECESVRNILFGVTGPIACLDPTAGLVSAGMSVASWQICNKMATPHRELFSCCGGDRPSAGCQVRYRCCRLDREHRGCATRFKCCLASPGSAGCLRKYSCCGQGESFAGCKEVCKKCGENWGSPPRACFMKDHNLERVDVEKGR